MKREAETVGSRRNGQKFGEDGEREIRKWMKRREIRKATGRANEGEREYGGVRWTTGAEKKNVRRIGRTEKG